MTQPDDGRQPTQGPPVAPIDPGPPPDAPLAATTGRRRGADEGWAATVAQGLALARWAAGEITARRIDGFSFIAWITGAVGLAFLALSIPVDPGWPFIGLGVLCMMSALMIRLALAIAAALMRRLALPRRARHLRPEVAAARARLIEAVTGAGVPVSIWSAVRFVFALALGRRPHAGVPGNLAELARHLNDVVEVDRLRQALRQAAPAPAWTGPNDNRTVPRTGDAPGAHEGR